MTTNRDVIIIGGGAAGLMCAIEAGKRERKVLVIEHVQRIGEKIRISGGGRCNFTNISADYSNFISDNPHFCKSAFARFTPQDFITMVERHGIAYHEKKLGQLFCDDSSNQIIGMLQKECDDAGVAILVNCTVTNISKGELFILETSQGTFSCESLVIATGGLSIPQIGATNFGYEIAKQFGVKVTKLHTGLVPLTLTDGELKKFKELSGVSLDAEVECNGVRFRENILFTHRGLSGPAILQISSYWKEGDRIVMNLLPDVDLHEVMKSHHQSNVELSSLLSGYFPKRFVEVWCDVYIKSKPVCQYSLKELAAISDQLHHWEIMPDGTEGYGKAEVTTGGVDTDELSSRTMEVKKVSGLYFIGEVVDVTGWLGGYNFQWAWASGFAAGQYV